MQTKDGTTVPGTDSQRHKEKQDNEKLKEQPTTDPALSDPMKTPGSGMVPDADGDAPSG